MSPRRTEGEDLQQLAVRSELLARRLAAEFPIEVVARLLAIEVMACAAASGGHVSLARIEEALLIKRAKAFAALTPEISKLGAVTASAEDIRGRAALRKVAKR